jgi:hypothetical protein
MFFVYNKVRQYSVVFRLLFQCSSELSKSSSLQLVTKQRQISVAVRNNAACGERLAVKKLSIIKLG